MIIIPARASVVETSNTAAVFSWQQTASAVAERLIKKVRSRRDEVGGGGITVMALLAQCCFQISGESDKGRISFLVETAATPAGKVRDAEVPLRAVVKSITATLLSVYVEFDQLSLCASHARFNKVRRKEIVRVRVRYMCVCVCAFPIDSFYFEALF